MGMCVIGWCVWNSTSEGVNIFHAGEGHFLMLVSKIMAWHKYLWCLSAEFNGKRR